MTLAGVNGHHLPTDEDGFLDFARGLRTPVIFEAIRNAEPLRLIHGYRHTANVRRHYERLDTWPEAFLVLGDAMCSFNPVYWPGDDRMCTRSDRAATRSGHSPGSLLPEIPAVRRQTRRRPVAGWRLREGLRWPETTGAKQSFSTRLVHRYIDRVIGVIPDGPYTFRRFGRVTHMMASPGSLFHPRVLWKAATRRQSSTCVDTNPLSPASDSLVQPLLKRLRD